MIETTIFNGVIDASPKEIEAAFDQFLYEEIYLPGINSKIEVEDRKRISIIYPEVGEKIINGYIYIFRESSTSEKPVAARIICCRQELIILFILISLRIQTKFTIGDYDPNLLTIPWRKLIASGSIYPMVTTPEEILLNNNIAPKAKERKFGHNKNIPYHVVKDLVSACLEYQKSGHTIEEFYHVKITSYYQGKFTFETFRKWVYGKQFE